MEIHQADPFSALSCMYVTFHKERKLNKILTGSGAGLQGRKVCGCQHVVCLGLQVLLGARRVGTVPGCGSPALVRKPPLHKTQTPARSWALWPPCHLLGAAALGAQTVGKLSL